MAVECRVCGRSVGRGPSGLGIKQHSKRHRREFRDLVGREPEDYQEVVEVLGQQPTLHQASLDERQLALPEAIQS